MADNTCAGPVDPAALRRLLLRVEADGHRCGWDVGDPAIYVLYDARDALTSRVFRTVLAGHIARVFPYVAQQCSPPGGMGEPTLALFRLALNLFAHHTGKNPPVLFPKAATLRAELDFVMGVLRQPGFLGFALVTEVWLNRTFENDQERRALWGDRALADIPTSTEARFVMAVDITGSDHVVHRNRGEAPQILPDGDRAGGPMIECLRLMTAVIADLPLPPLPATPRGWVPPDGATK